jgi:raffinose/stachyose/melibiose transport system permease protein
MMTTPTRARSRRAGSPSRRKRSDLKVALVFLIPLILMYGVYYIFSIYFLVQTSFTRVSISFFDSVNVGWNNYLLLVSDPEFLHAILNNLIFAGVAIAASLTVGFFIAIALSTGVRAKRLMYVLFLLPTLMPSALIASIFGSMLEQQYGTLNETLRFLGLGFLTQTWLETPGLAYGSVAVLFAYLIGLPILFYTSDLSALPTDALEAALIDGAGTFRIMRSVIYPMMKATHITVILSILLGSFRAFELVLFTTNGGPNGLTEIAGTYLLSFSQGGPTIGYVSAAAIIVLVVAFIISIVQMFVLREKRVGK